MLPLWAVGADCVTSVVAMCIPARIKESFIDSSSSIRLLMGNIFPDMKIIGTLFHVESTVC